MSINRFQLNLLNDFIFKKILGEVGAEEQLKSFLSAVLKRTGRDKDIDGANFKILESKTLTADLIEGKTSILDVLAELDDGSKVNIEVQLKSVGNMGTRSAFYWSKLFANSLEAGEKYEKLPKVITINILGSQFLQDTREYHTSFHLYEDFNKDLRLTDNIEIHLKKKKLEKKDIENNSLHRWLTYLDKNTSPETIKELVKMDNAFQAVEKTIENISRDQISLMAYHKREMEIHDHVSAISSAKEEGREEGEKKGREEEKLSVAKNLLSLNAPMELILKSTGLSLEDIEKLKQRD